MASAGGPGGEVELASQAKEAEKPVSGPKGRRRAGRTREPKPLVVIVVSVKDTLLLDQGYQPLRVIPWQRAICMSFLGKVEMVATHDRPIRTVAREFPAPAVVRLLGPYRPQQYIVRFSREGVHVRDRYTCQYCGLRPSRRELTLDHVLPRHRGGPTSWENIVTACSPCNLRKGGRTPDEAGMPLDSPPYRPRWVPPSRSALGLEEVPRPWTDWLTV